MMLQRALSQAMRLICFTPHAPHEFEGLGGVGFRVQVEDSIKGETLNLNPKNQTLNPKTPKTLNPKPETLTTLNLRGQGVQGPAPKVSQAETSTLGFKGRVEVALGLGLEV